MHVLRVTHSVHLFYDQNICWGLGARASAARPGRRKILTVIR